MECGKLHDIDADAAADAVDGQAPPTDQVPEGAGPHVEDQRSGVRGDSYVPPMGATQDRAKLIARLEVEARAFQNAKGTSIRDVRWGKVLGLLNAGTVLGLWSRSASGKASDAIFHGMPVRGLGKLLTPRKVAKTGTGSAVSHDESVSSASAVPRSRSLAVSRLPCPSLRPQRPEYGGSARSEDDSSSSPHGSQILLRQLAGAIQGTGPR